MIVGTPARQRVVEHAYRVLRPGGTFIVHAHNYWFNANDPAGRSWLVRDLFAWLLGRGSGDRPMPPHHGVVGLHLHHFTRRELLHLLEHAGFSILDVLPVGLGPGGTVPGPAWLRGLRTYGYLVAAQRRGRIPS
jgi:SAM-dependent methyltransferase